MNGALNQDLYDVAQRWAANFFEEAGVLWLHGGRFGHATSEMLAVVKRHRIPFTIEEVVNQYGKWTLCRF